MNSRAKHFFYDTVKPTVDEFLDEPGSMRRARLAAIVLYHLADYWDLDRNEGTGKRTVPKCYQRLGEICPEFLTIRDVADASKHANLVQQQSHIPRTMNSAQQLLRSPGLFEAPFGEGVFNEAVQVFAKLNDGQEVPIVQAVQSVLAMWARILDENNAT